MVGCAASTGSSTSASSEPASSSSVPATGSGVASPPVRSTPAVQTSPPAPESGSGLTGLVLQSVCPPSAEQTCGAPPKPVRAVVTVTRRTGVRQEVHADTDDHGRYRIALPVGDYLVQARPAEPSTGTTCTPVEVAVFADRFVEAPVITCA